MDRIHRTPLRVSSKLVEAKESMIRLLKEDGRSGRLSTSDLYPIQQRKAGRKPIPAFERTLPAMGSQHSSF